MKYEPCPHGVARTRISKDGLTANCKDCLKIRDKNRANNPERVEARKEYQKTEAYRESAKKASRKYGKSENGKATTARWQTSNPKKRAVHGVVAYRLKIGEIKKSPCEVCGCEKVHGHHDDYNKPLEVRWLCDKCHNKWHVENGEGANAQ